MMNRERIHIAGMLLVIALAYLPSLSGELILDDYPLVKQNAFIRDFHPVAVYLAQEDGASKDRSGQYHSGYYRPLINLLYTLDYKIWGMQPSKFRLNNLILHLLSTLMLYQLLRHFTKDHGGAIWSALLFGLHPLNTESVAWVSSRNNIVVTLLGLSCLYFYVKRSDEPDRRAGLLCLVCFFFALLSKEFALMLLPICVLYDQTVAKDRKRARKAVYGYLAFATIIIFYLILRHYGTQSFIRIGESHNFLRSLYHVPFLILYNLRIIFLPWGLHNFMVHYPRDYWGWEALSGFAAMGLLGLFLWKQRKQRLLLFSWLSFLAALLPVLHVMPTSAVSLVSMRWLYFPMAFLCIAGALAIHRIFSWRVGLYRVLIPGALVLYLGTYTFVLNENLWKNEERFFKQEVLGFQNHFYASDLANLYHDQGDLQGAYAYFQKALQRKSISSQRSLFINYAALLVDMDRVAEAMSYLDRAEQLGPSWQEQASIDINRGVAYFKMGHYDKAIKSLLKASKWDPKNAILWVNLANAYGATGQYQTAISLYQRAIDLGSDPLSARKYMGLTYLKMGDFLNTVRSLEEIPREVRAQDPDLQGMLMRAKQALGPNPFPSRGEMGKEDYTHVE